MPMGSGIEGVESLWQRVRRGRQWDGSGGVIVATNEV